jgi:hypothetical protein
MSIVDWQMDYEEVLRDSNALDGAMGAIAFAVLEMFRRGGMDEEELNILHEKMKEYFMVATNEECNAICRMVETRLQIDKRSENGYWYNSSNPFSPKRRKEQQ